MPCKLRGFGGGTPKMIKLCQKDTVQGSLFAEGKIPFPAEPGQNFSLMRMLSFATQWRLVKELPILPFGGWLVCYALC